MDSGSEVSSIRATRVFFAQVFVIYIVILISLYNLTWGSKDGRELWISLLSSAIGYLLPPPYMQDG